MWVYGLWLAVAAFFPIFGCAEESGIWSGKADVGWFTDTEADGAYTISTAEQLAGLALLVNSGTGFEGKTVTLGGDIWLNDTAGWQGWDSATAGLKQWTPIGGENGFKGVFDGDNHKIMGLYININDSVGYGLFGQVDSSAVVKDVGVVGGYVNVSGGYITGGLVGINVAGHISNSYVSGMIIGNSTVGGLVGFNRNGDIRNSHVSGTVKGYGSVGGLVGENLGGGVISDSYVSGEIGQLEGRNIGGLVGSNDNKSTIRNCHVSGVVNGREEVGGLASINSGKIINSYVTSNVRGEIGVGGLVGGNRGGSISNSYTINKVLGSNGLGGLVGVNRDGGTISKCYAAGKVIGDGEYIGGLVGFNKKESYGSDGDNLINNSYYDSQISGVHDSDKGIPKTTAWM